MAVRGRCPLMLRTGWVVVRRKVRVSPSSSSTVMVVSDATWNVPAFLGRLGFRGQGEPFAVQLGTHVHGLNRLFDWTPLGATGSVVLVDSECAGVAP